ncbi:hypothetical protein [Nocardioides sp. Arc9.136]|uniref:hypothetical protein n=1 Tax=Nocardioides sp. Arc9.136 TaxID=2996826 RepID=UPI00266679E0|nr:hypothetical protein [Nocardioides sp. Arc9.136]WKN48842.1 hypothetical protein OSR43_01600 [Nocardioides sp. Arc9.136]
MATTTSGQISVTPVRIHTTATLEALQDAIGKDLYRGKPGSRGWGSVKDGTDPLIGRVTRERPSGGRPEPVFDPDPYPKQLRARLYWDERDKRLEQVIGMQGDSTAVSLLRAADVTFAPSSQDGELVGLLGERNDGRLRAQVLPAVEDLVRSVDKSATLQRDDNDLSFGDDDFFRWVLYRATHDPELNDDLEILWVRSMANQDVSFRATSMTRGVELDRPELLALLAGALNKFGPAKIIVSSESLSLRVSLEVTSSGAFSIYRGDTEYDYDLNDEPLSDDEEGLKLLQDVAFEILPELKRLHNADSDWRDTNRDAFRQEARHLLQGVLDAL